MARIRKEIVVQRRLVAIAKLAHGERLRIARVMEVVMF